MSSADAVIVLVRHAQSIWSAAGRFQGTSDPPLSEIGVLQTAAVARRLADAAERQALAIPAGAPVMVRHSPLGRATLTAQAIGTAFGNQVPMIVDDALLEVSQGAWEGLTHDVVLSRWPREYEAWRADPALHHAPDGESLADAAIRARQALAAAGAALDESSAAGRWVVVVAHDGILRLILLSALRLDLAHYWSFPFIQCGITVLQRGAVFALKAHNASGHLAAERLAAG